MDNIQYSVINLLLWITNNSPFEGVKGPCEKLCNDKIEQFHIQLNLRKGRFLLAWAIYLQDSYGNGRANGMVNKSIEKSLLRGYHYLWNGGGNNIENDRGGVLSPPIGV